MFQLFDKNKVENIVEEYRLGAYYFNGHDDFTTFPSIDFQGRIRDIKIQRYHTDITSDDFCHCDKSNIMWIGKSLTQKGILPPHSEFDHNCLFGEHLLKKYPSATVMLVESPKNALIGAAYMPENVWIATGNKNMLKRDVLNVLRERKVMVIPDRDAIQEWESKLSTMQDIATFVTLPFCEECAPSNVSNYDIADYLIEQIKAKQLQDSNNL